MPIHDSLQTRYLQTNVIRNTSTNGSGRESKFFSKLNVFRSEQSSLPGELAATFIASLEAPKIELLYKENDAIKCQRAHDVNTEDKVQIEETSCLMIKARQCLIAIM